MTSAIRAHRDAEDGFTLIELLVVVIIIGILAAIAIPAFLNQRENAWASSVESDLRNFAIEVESTATQNNGQYDRAAIDTAQGAFNFSDNVTVVVERPAAAATTPTTSFCMTGSHALVTAGDPGSSTAAYVYDSNNGGLDSSGTGSC